MYYVMLLQGFFIHDFCNLYSDVHSPITYELLDHLPIAKQSTSQSIEKVNSNLFIWESEKLQNLNMVPIAIR